MLPKFKKVMPIEFRRALDELSRQTEAVVDEETIVAKIKRR